MKKLLLLTIVAISFSFAIGQNGPAGIGNSTNNVLWLDANTLGLTNGDPVPSWTDNSGNGNNATQGTPGDQPSFSTNRINGRPAITFNGTSTHLDLPALTNNAITVFFVTDENLAKDNAILSTDSHYFAVRSNFNLFASYYTGFASRTVPRPNDGFRILTSTTDGNAAPTNVRMSSGTFVTSTNRPDLRYWGTSAVGIRSVGGVHHYSGDIAEIIIYNQKLNTAERTIVSNYLAGKYNLNASINVYNFKSTHGNDVFGIGAAADGNVTSADNGGRITFNNASSLGTGDYLLIGHDSAGFGASTSTPGIITQRWSQVWRWDETGNVGTVDMVINFNGATLPSSDPNNYVILYETNDGDFSNGDTEFINVSSIDGFNLTATFNGVDLPDGAYFTLAEKVGNIVSAQDGQWDETATWNCGCIPTQDNNVEVDHKITIDANAEAKDVVIDAGSIAFSGSDTLAFYEDFVVNGGLNTGSGTISALSNSPQTFVNSTGGTLSLHNLFVNCDDPLQILTGVWELDNNLQVSNGGLDVSGATSFTLTSDASNISQILPSITGAFTGNFTVQRHISARSANFANVSSPMEDATMADLDDDLVLSGLTGGNDGNAVASGSKTLVFYSIYEYDAQNVKHDTVDNVTEDIRQGIGYEVYLANNLTNFTGATIDFVGTPASGPLGVKSPTIHPGWNLIGNPYHSFISYDDLDLQADLDGTFWIYNSSTGSYDPLTFGTNQLIAPGQGFWVDKTSGVARSFDFEEADKSESHSSAFLRKGSSKAEIFKINIREKGSIYNQNLFIQFSGQARETYDEMDARYLPSPHAEIPALTSKAVNSDRDLSINSVDNLTQSQVIPIEVKSGKEGTYEMKAEDLDAVYNSYNCIFLKDKQENKIIDLSVDSKYEFQSEKGEFDRFDLIVSKDYTSCQKAIEEDNSISQKIDQLFDLRNNMSGWWLDYSFDSDLSKQVELKVYNLSGQEVIKPSNFSVVGSGTIQLDQLNELNGIYLIQIVSEGEILNKTVKL